jgi:hypothetical protein
MKKRTFTDDQINTLAVPSKRTFTDDQVGEKPQSHHQIDPTRMSVPPRFDAPMDPNKKAAAQILGAFDLATFNHGGEILGGASNLMDQAAYFLGAGNKPRSYRDHLNEANDLKEEYAARRELDEEDPNAIAWDEWGNLASNAGGLVGGFAPFGAVFKGGMAAAKIPSMLMSGAPAKSIIGKGLETGLGWTLGGIGAHELSNMGNYEATPEEIAAANAPEEEIPGVQKAAGLPNFQSALPILGAQTPTAGGLAMGAIEGFGGNLFGHTVVAPVLKAGTRMVGDLFRNANEGGARMLAEKIADNNSSPQKIWEAFLGKQKLNPQATMMEAGPEGIIDYAGTIIRKPGEGREIGTKFLTERQRGATRRVVDNLREATGLDGKSFNQTMKDLTKSRAEAAKPLYDKAHEIGAIVDDQLTRALHNPEWEAPLVKGLSLAKAEGVPMNELVVMDASGKRVIGYSSKAIDYAKQAFDDKITNLRMSGNNNEARILAKVRDKAIDRMDAINPDYKAARAQFAGDSAVMDAFEQGKSLFNKHPRDIEDVLAGLKSDSEKEFFRRGFASMAEEAVSKTPGLTGDAAGKVIGSDWKDDALRAVLGEEKFTQLKGNYDLERQFNANFKDTGAARVYDTARKLASDADEEMAGGVELGENLGQLHEAIASGPGGIANWVAQHGMSKIVNLLRLVGKERRAGAAKMIFSRDPAQVKAALDLIQQYMPAAERARSMGRGTGAYIAGSAANSQTMRDMENSMRQGE